MADTFLGTRYWFLFSSGNRGLNPADLFLVWGVFGGWALSTWVKGKRWAYWAYLSFFVPVMLACFAFVFGVAVGGIDGELQRGFLEIASAVIVGVLTLYSLLILIRHQ